MWGRKSKKVEDKKSVAIIRDEEGNTNFKAMAIAICDSAEALLKKNKTTKKNEFWKAEFANIIVRKRAASSNLNVLNDVVAELNALEKKDLPVGEEVELLAKKIAALEIYGRSILLQGLNLEDRQATVDDFSGRLIEYKKAFSELKEKERLLTIENQKTLATISETFAQVNRANEEIHGDLLRKAEPSDKALKPIFSEVKASHQHTIETIRKIDDLLKTNHLKQSLQLVEKQLEQPTARLDELRQEKERLKKKEAEMATPISPVRGGHHLHAQRGGNAGVADSGKTHSGNVPPTIKRI